MQHHLTSTPSYYPPPPPPPLETRQLTHLGLAKVSSEPYRSPYLSNVNGHNASESNPNGFGRSLDVGDDDEDDDQLPLPPPPPLPPGAGDAKNGFYGDHMTHLLAPKPAGGGAKYMLPVSC
jgi:hypothetical protein